MTEAAGDRRPLTSRDSRWAQVIARRMAGMSITPNQISQASMLAAALAGVCFWWAGQETGAARIILLLLAALFCQLRLLCNLFDGMVAVEGGKAAADGPFWNEFPDRVADLLIFAGAGYGVGMPEIGFAAGAFAVLTAYVRELGRANGLASDFSGPMAKQHRMATITAAAVLSTFAPLWNGRDEILVAALLVIALGAAFTALRRGIRIVAGLKAGTGNS
ncbi:MAG: CDP-alcohol phosphatidyltransferase family protein [Hoeflea sp.]|uniref:CDP-alcohol phosphatidyltransferase family protein n=1 Tax=Hoeflea sp. TaxID=1940281 RepID=UPI001D7A8B32|nr:CDP-alcohol phosphatidyltransferase family protein [Hoeflea sp.]MBU4530662.1 CDP-alcohol phosphatidyltransferase family protein [Alphaproteobacteria bacterium]MBU4544882.1 CDP-alcohol phosphatidyltransferase family protein [Alphaproteobacteria bacterium]MBU4552025.1 CDP-alcohol phosphatidyltransferase family protein [Alphaproteobacteria bacterium]MBV1722214.1 CDP-alcohol phosphatidyltransferase family protein [Hoeflea sp.]MBV1761776.1 CDP-alcohol phosphatidyltransferase family protein [Hoef